MSCFFCRIKEWGLLMSSFFAFYLVPVSCGNVYSELEEEMITIPVGTVVIGSEDPLADADEHPAHVVTIPSFKIEKYEVSQRLWEEVMGYNPSFHKGDNYPVECVSIHEILEFINRLNKKTNHHYRLPNELEWEYVASLASHDNKDLDSYAWFEPNAGNKSHERGMKNPSSPGIYDIIGNVHEWCLSIYDGCDYNGDKVLDIDPNEIEYVFRGGAFNCSLRYCRRTNRNHAVASTKNYAIGFRLAE